MASSQPYTVAVNGGLVSSSNVIDLLKTPGVAKDLRNFEVSTEGGYRRINGYQKFGTTNATKPTGSVTNILGVFPYADGVIVCQGDDIYWSTTGTSYTQINKNTYKTKTGTVSVTAGSATVTGSSTVFTTEFAVNDRIQINNVNYRVLSITSDTVLTLDFNVVSSVSGQAVKNETHNSNT